MVKRNTVVCNIHISKVWHDILLSKGLQHNINHFKLIKAVTYMYFITIGTFIRIKILQYHNIPTGSP